MPDLELPLLGRNWQVTLPLEDWSRLVQAVQVSIEVTRDEHLDKVLQQALAAATAVPPEYDVHVEGEGG